MVTHPGPRPRAVEFPFGAAHQAMARIEELMDELGSVSRHHEQVRAVDPLRFSGSSRDAFGSIIDRLTTDLGSEQTHLTEQYDSLADLVGRAERLRARREDDIRSWEQAMERHREHLRGDGAPVR